MLFSKTVKLEKATSNDGFDNTYGTATYPTCNYWEKQKLIKDSDKIFLTVAHLYFPAGTQISESDKITLNNGKTAPIVLIASKGDTTTERFLSVYLGSYIGSA